jgi:hypothetical protein
MNKKYLILSKLMALLLTEFTQASTTMPYFGPEQKNCVINRPSEVDSNYIADEDCTRIYVLPPSRGRFDFSTPSYSMDTDMCPAIRDEIAEITAKDPVTHRHSKDWIAERDSFIQSIYEMNPDHAGFLSGAAMLDWNKLIDQYQQLNPKVTVLKMPIQIGALTIGLSGGSSSSDLMTKNQIGRLDITGVKFPRLGVSNGLSLYENLFKDQNTFIMGQSLGFTLGLSLPAACDLKSEQHADAMISATYTYIYPVQTKGILKISLKTDSIQNEVKSFILSKQGSFSPEELNKMVTEKGVFEIEINTGAFSGVSPSDLNAYKDDLMKLATQGLISALRNNFDQAKADATVIQYWKNWRTECSGFLFWNSCKTINWITQTEEINWNKVAEDVLHHLEGVVSAEASQYKTFFQISTSAIVGKGSSL